jgi:hypothetical protein
VNTPTPRASQSPREPRLDFRAQKAAQAASKGERADRGSRKANDLVRQ